MTTPFITIIGLDIVGASLGLALRQGATNFEVIGFDRNGAHEDRARKLGAVHRTVLNIHKACDGASMVIMATSLAETEELLGVLADTLDPKCLVLALHTLLQPTLDAAARALPAQHPVVAGHVVLTELPTTPHSALLKDATFCLAAPSTVDAAAFGLASDFVERIGAKPHFVDASEHDGIMANVEQAPQLLGMAMMAASATASGWQEAQRLAGHRFAAVTETNASAVDLFHGLQANRDHVRRRLQQLQAMLEDWQDLLMAEPEEGKPHPLLTALQEAEKYHTAWASQLVTKDWSDLPPDASTSEQGGGIFRQLFLGNWGRRLNKPDSNRERKA